MKPVREDTPSQELLVVIDNDEKFRKTLADVLSLKGFEVLACASGTEGWGMIQERRPAVALIDIRMEDISGLEIIRRVRASTIPTECIVLTAYSSHASAIEAVNIGAYQYLQKPFNMEQLFVTIRRAAEKRKAEEALLVSMERYRNLVEHAQEGIFQFTPEGRCLMANPAMAHMLGYPSPLAMEESFQGGLTEIFSDALEAQKVLEILDKNGAVRGREVRIGTEDGSPKWMFLYARKVFDQNGKFLYYEGIGEDITSRKKAEEELTNTLSRLRRAMEGVIQAMAMAVETRDPYTAGHQKKVANLARAIAQEMGLDSSIIDGIRMAAAIHDIGKIAVPAEILSKPTKLTELEFNLIKIHPTAGYDILKGIEFPWTVAEIVRQHHEKIDGSGYPLGLSGSQICIEARILCVADVVEAMGSHRPYRPTLGLARALQEITDHRGTLFDPDAVDACLVLFRQKGFSLD
jgi:PAS domain S-box-containing protein/putative nucleotidyltransferase with HDIG domain